MLARDLTCGHIVPNGDGEIEIADAPGLGIEVNSEALTRYAVDVEIKVDGRVLFASPAA